MCVMVYAVYVMCAEHTTNGHTHTHAGGGSPLAAAKRPTGEGFFGGGGGRGRGLGAGGDPVRQAERESAGTQSGF